MVKTRLQVSGDGTNGARNYKALGIRGTVSIIATEVIKLREKYILAPFLSLTMSLPLCHPHSLSPSIYLTHPSFLSPTFTLSLSRAHTHSVLHTLFLSQDSSLSLPLLFSTPLSRRALWPSGKVSVPPG